MPYRYTEQPCVICGKTFKAARRDSYTCSVACQAKLYRERRRIEAERAAQSLDASHVALVKRLQIAAPSAFQEIRRIDALYGRQATEFTLAAIESVLSSYRRQLLARYPELAAQQKPNAKE